MDGTSSLFADGLAGAWTRTAADDGAGGDVTVPRPAATGPADDEWSRTAFRTALAGFLVDGTVPPPGPVREPGATGGTVLRIDDDGPGAGRLVCRVGTDRVTVHGRYAGRLLDPVVAGGIAEAVVATLDGGPGPVPAGAARIEGGPVTPIDVVERVLHHARHDPGRIAVRAGDTELGYGELAERSRRYAARLDAAGAADVVVVPYRRDLRTVVALVGVLASGRAFLLRADDRDEHQDDVAAWVGATRSAPEPSPDDPGPAVAAPVSSVSAVAAYVMFTSGTTGRPKAVVVQRDQLAAYCGFLVTEGICGPGVTMPVLSSPEFDAVIKQIVGQLAGGGTVAFTGTTDVLAGIEAALAPGGPAEPVVNTVPTVWSQYLDVHGDRPVGAGGALLLGGEALDPALVERTRRVWPRVRIANLYGPAECTSNATWAPDVGADGDRTPVGSPIRGTDVHVLDARLAPVGPGRVGRLYVAGACVARGYHSDPRRTAAAFRPDPGSSTGARMYETGDRVRFTSAGLVYLGRDDAQVKVNGIRIDTESLRADLAALPGVRAAAVGLADGALRVFVEPAPGSTHEAAEDHIRRAWRRELRGVRAEPVDRIPATSTGKADLAALCARHPAAAVPAPGAGEPAGTTVPAAPHRVLEVIWSSVFGTERIDASSSATDLGVDSMKQLRLVALYRRILRAEVSFDDFAGTDRIAEHQRVLEERVGRTRLDEAAALLEEPAR
ncbi:non-ribosomal peptide synthetase [Pseudonocardia sp. HH130630-07]|uniref:non-ribosomal peptide synthetase n=1 Tax=Pseudonocardia sp. HH130630-07 TaxID=1690815 RepID=UPI000B2D2DD9|nr:non-ribosomal peptide synthetase [Pseudonocardia sp. HH130630-07]